MADTALKFGPEWLRALTEPQADGGGALYQHQPLPNIKLAEFRYGKEEILALFDKNVKPPEELVNFGSLFVEKCQFPLNLMQMSEDESRAWQRGANSDASQRPFGPPGKRPPSPTGGRGRGRGRGSAPYYDRNRSMDEELLGGGEAGGPGGRPGGGQSAERGFPRGGSGARNGLGGYERQTSERGGGWFDRQQSRGGPGEEETNGVASPRKGYTRAPFDDWRRGGDGGEAAAGGQPGAEGAEGWRTSGSRRWGGAGAGLASGQGWRTERESYNRAKFGSGDSSGGSGSARPPPTNDRWRRDDLDTRSGGGFSQQRGGAGPGRGRRGHGDNLEHLPEWATDDPSEGGSFDMEGKFRAEQQRNGVARNGDDWRMEDTNSRWEDEEVDPEDVEAADDRGPGANNSSNNNKDSSGNNKSNGSGGQQSGGGSFEAAVAEDGGRVKEVSTPSSWDSPSSLSDKQDYTGDPGLEAAKDPLDNLVSSLVDEDDGPPPDSGKMEAAVSSAGGGQVPAAALVPSPPPAAGPGHSWSYLDPQNQVQGPFQSDEMLEWYSAGYFPPDLMLRRSCDQRFVPLKDLVKLYSRIPFTPGPHPPPLLDTQEEERLKQQQLQQQLLHQQQMLMQQQLLAQQQQQEQQRQQQQQQQQQHMLGGMPGGGGPDLSKLLQFGAQQQQPQHGLGSLGLGDMARHGGHYPDPRLNLLGNLGPGLGQPEPPAPAADPLKQLLARSQAGPAMPGLGRPFAATTPPQHPDPRTHPAPQPPQPDPFSAASLFGGMAPHPASVSGRSPVSEPPPLTLPYPSKPPVPQQQAAPGPQQLPPSSGFDPIQSLLAQLQGSSSHPASPQLLARGPPQPAPAPEQPPFNHRPPQSIWDLPGPGEGAEVTRHSPLQETKPLNSIWNEPMPASHHQSESPREMIHQHKDIHEPTEETNINEEFDHSESNSQDLEPETSEIDPTTFVKPKANEKKDKKTKKAEEKRKAKEARKAAEAAGPYIPGMSGTVRPDEQIVATGNIMDIKEEEKVRDQHEAIRRQREQMDALAKLQEDQKAKLEREEQVRLQQERLAKLAPWAKKETSPVKEHQQGGHQLSLQEIQRLEAERERQDRAAREAAEARLREEQRRAEEEERRSRASKTVNWATAAAAPGAAGNKVKSLAEIQAEEARVERERQERELAARPRTGKEAAAGSAGGSIWGGGVSASRTSTWAGKIAAAAPAPPAQQSRGGAWSGANGSSGQSSAAVVAPAGFWDPVVPEPEPRQQQMKKQTSASNNNNSNKGKNQKRRDGGGSSDDHHGNARGGGKQKPKNEFEDWCSRALSDLQAQVDIPTFLGFLMDIESPYDVHDYVKSYVGEGKAQKKFATDYLERRSRWKNSLKSGARYEDDLTTPATALTPGGHADSNEFQEAGKKGRGKKGLTKQSKSKQDISHLLGFSVQGQGVNRGELDMPQ